MIVRWGYLAGANSWFLVLSSGWHSQTQSWSWDGFGVVGGAANGAIVSQTSRQSCGWTCKGQRAHFGRSESCDSCSFRVLCWRFAWKQLCCACDLLCLLVGKLVDLLWVTKRCRTVFNALQPCRIDSKGCLHAERQARSFVAAQGR